MRWLPSLAEPCLSTISVLRLLPKPHFLLQTLVFCADSCLGDFSQPKMVSVSLLYTTCVRTMMAAYQDWNPCIELNNGNPK
jgi:hypothetical protein